MTGARLTAALECANDAGGRCALWPSGDAHACYGVSHDTATSCAFAAGSVSAARAALTGTGATPQSEGLVRVRTQVCLRTPAPVPWGRSRSINPYAGRRFERRFEAADHPFADRLAVWQPGITEQGRGTPDGSGRSPRRQAWDAPVLGTQRGGSLRSRRPWCNRKAASDIRNRWRAHGNGVSVHMHLDVDVHARHATDPRRSAVKIGPPSRSRHVCKTTFSS